MRNRLRSKKIVSIGLGIMIALGGIKGASAAGNNYAYSIGVNHGWFGSHTGDFTKNVNYAATAYGMISGLSSYKNYSPDVTYMRGNNPDGIRRIGSRIVFLNGHGNYDNMIFNYGNKGGSYATGVYYGKDLNSSSGYSYAGIQDTNMSGVDLISFVGCSTGANSGDNLGSRAVKKGATTAVAFKNSINSRNTKGPEWLVKYHDALASGYTVKGAINYATSLYPTSNLGDYAVIYGTTSNTITSYSKSVAEEKLDGNLNTLETDFYIDDLSDVSDAPLLNYQDSLKAIINKINEIENKTIDIDKYKVSINNYSEDSGMIIISYFIGDEVKTNKAYIATFEEGKIDSINYVDRGRHKNNFDLESEIIERLEAFKLNNVSKLNEDDIIEKYYYDYDNQELTYVYSTYTVEPELNNVIIEAGEEIVID
ncbi:MAG: hypothetical protein Q3980_01020 [Turicibacter sp.]|nr:hypothetical protein [Turicibacter sp.]